jgi:hypothetical protein
MLIMIIGVISFSFAVGSLSSVLTSLDNLQAKIKQKYTILENIANDYNLDTHFLMRLREVIKYQYTKNEVDKYQLLNDLPPKEKSELAHLMNEELTTKFTFFTKLPSEILLFLLPLIKHVKIHKGDFIFEEGDPADSIYFVVKGKANYVLKKYHETPYINVNECNIFLN